MEEIVMRVRRRHGSSRVQIEVDYLIDGRSAAERTPVRIPLSLGVSHLTFDHACDLARGLEAGVRELVTEPALFDVARRTLGPLAAVMEADDDPFWADPSGPGMRGADA